MTTLFPMQMLTSTNQANLQAMQAITSSMLNAVERIAALNLGMSHGALEYVSSSARLMQGDNWTGILSPPGAGLRSLTESTVAYVQSVQDISVTVQNEITQAISAREGAVADAMTAVLDHLERSTPASATPAVATVKSAISNVRSLYDSMLKTSQQVAQANAAAVASTAAAIGVAAPAARAKKAA